MDRVCLEKAKEIVCRTDAVFAYVSHSETITSDKKGIGFVASLCNDKRELSDGCAADKIVGRAAAFLFVFLGIKSVYAKTLSKGAACIFDEYGIEYEYETMTQAIVNRKGDGLCPMEMAVKDVNTPNEALDAVNRTLDNLRKQK